MSPRTTVLLQFIISVAGLVGLNARAEGDKPLSAAEHDRARFLTIIGGCNDCHTPGFADKEGQVPEADWFTGDVLGWHGAWGTTYPINLRIYMSALSEDQWIEAAGTIKPRPPMPWWALREMSDDDLRIIYRFITSLKPKGEPAPAFIPPDQQPSPPYMEFIAPPPAPK
jgi:mono/diheme cytochrome c family protein